MRLRNGPVCSRWATIPSANDSVTPDTRASSGTDAVFRSTPTAFTASSTTASRLRASVPGVTSCWYCPTPIDFGSIFTSSASGSCSRRAIDTAPRSVTSSSGSSRAAYADAEYTDAPASLTIAFVGGTAPAARMSAMSSAASASVSRDAVPLPTAINSTSWRATSAASVALACVPLLLRLMRKDGAGVDDLAGGVDDGHLDAGAESRVEAERRARARRRGEQQVPEVPGEHVHRIQLGALPQPHAGVDGRRDHQLDPPRQPHGGRQPRRRRGPGGHVDAERLGDHRLVELVVAAVHLERQHLLLLTAHDGEHSVRRHGLQRLGEFEVVAKLLCRRAFGHLLRRRGRAQRAVRPELLPNGADEFGVLGRALDDDVARPVERRGGVGHVVAEESRGRVLGHQRRIGQQLVGERLEAGFAGDLRLGPPLGLVRQVDVLDAATWCRRPDSACAGRR